MEESVGVDFECELFWFTVLFDCLVCRDPLSRCMQGSALKSLPRRVDEAKLRLHVSPSIVSSACASSCSVSYSQLGGWYNISDPKPEALSPKP